MESNGLFGWVENREERKETRENEMFSIVWLRIRQMGGAFFIRAHKNSLSKLERKSGFRVLKDFLPFILLHDFSFLVKAYKLYFSSFHFSILPSSNQTHTWKFKSFLFSKHFVSFYFFPSSQPSDHKLSKLFNYVL